MPDDPGDLLELSATALAALVREGTVRAVDVVAAHVAHLRRVNPPLNALVAERFDAARAEAALVDEAVARGDTLPPFAGVPCSVKESFALVGMPQTAGLVARIGRRVERDATVVARLRAAGAIPLGVSNLSELCMWMESANRVYGRTGNPYDPRRTAGGSSGGEGALVGAGAAPFGLGADIGGSIRMPAFFGGVFGHKPTGGMVPNTGEFPIPSAPAAMRFHVRGPIARRAADLMPLLRVLAGPDGVDPSCEPFALGDPEAVAVADLVVLDVPDDGRGAVHPELAAAQRRVAAHLARRGARVETVRVPAFRDAFAIWAATLQRASGERYAEILGGGGPPVSGLRELVRWAVRRSPHTFPSIALTLIEAATARLPGAMERHERAGRALRRELADRLGDRGVLLYPPHPVPAPRHGVPLLRPTRWVYTAIFNVLELPVTQVPLGLSRRGLPLGVQVAAAHGNDHLTIAVARELERAFGGWVPPWRARRR